MKALTITEKMKLILSPKISGIKARLFVTREDGITIYDSVQDHTTTSVSALVSGVWQASEALMGLAHPNHDIMEFRLGFDTTSQGIYLFPINVQGKRYFLGAIYQNCVNPGQLKHQISRIKEEMDKSFLIENTSTTKKTTTMNREGFLFKDISDEEIDRLFSLGRI
jgi:hypothetical protein